MVDTLNPEERSRRMALVKGKDTRPEMLVRKIVYALGYRYRLHVRSLPGTPDLVFHGKRKALFVHGCFWHRHRAASCRLARMPKSKQSFWMDKLEGNRKRDLANIRKLRGAGWKVLQIWECQLNDIQRLQRRILRFLQ